MQIDFSKDLEAAIHFNFKYPTKWNLPTSVSSPTTLKTLSKAERQIISAHQHEILFCSDIQTIDAIISLYEIKVMELTE